MRETRKLYVETRDRVEMAASQRIMSVSGWELEKFLSVLSSENISLLLNADKCCNYVDNYLLATVFVYFKRAALRLDEYTEENFWKCLYLAHDMEEDEEELKWELLPWALGSDWRNKHYSFLRSKDNLWARMGYRSVVSKNQCKQIMKLPIRTNIWTRQREANHSGAVRRAGDFLPLGPEKSEEVQARMSELFIVVDSMDEEEDTDSGLDSSDENYMNIEIFA